MRNGEVAGIRGEFGLVGDRHLDLAVIQHSIHRTLGAEAVFGFYEAYGSDPNIVALDHYVLTGLLLGWIE
jgi:aminoglycoside phosphotransferase